MLNQAVFLVGGLGTRLKDQTRNTPKPLLKIADRPFIEYLLDEVSRHGFNDIVLVSGHLGGQVEELYQDRVWRNARIRVLREPEPLGTGGALRFAAPHLNPAFLLSNGDSFFDINLRALTQENIPRGGAVMALRPVANDTRYGCVAFENGLVRSFHAPEERISGPINAGIYAMDRTLIERIPNGPVSLEGKVFPPLAREGRLRGSLFEGFFIDIGVPHDFQRADAEFLHHITRPAVFFDRDGVLNADTGYVHKPEDFQWLDGAKKAIRLCNDLGALVFVVTNQAGVARGMYTEHDVHALHGWMTEQLASIGAHVDAFEYCPDHPEGTVESYRRHSSRRKPEPGMILDLLSAWPVDRARSFLIGDKESDISAAAAAGIAGHHFNGGDLYEYVARRLTEAGIGRPAA